MLELSKSRGWFDAMNAADISEEVRSLVSKSPRHIQASFRLWCAAIAAVDAAPNKLKRRTARVWSRRLGVTPGTVFGKRSLFRKCGAMALLDKRFPQFWPARSNILPAPAIACLKALADAGQLSPKDAIRAFAGQLRRWRKGDASAKIPGYEMPPQGNPPPGWTPRNLARYLKTRPKADGGKVRCEILVRIHYNGKITCIKRSPTK